MRKRSLAKAKLKVVTVKTKRANMPRPMAGIEDGKAAAAFLEA